MRRALLLTVLLLCCGAVVATGAAATVVTSRSATGTSIVSLINDARRAHRLKPLRVSQRLARAASGHARAMARLGFFAHESADGTSAATRIRRFYRGSTVGETLLWRSPDVTPREALRMWLASPPHRSILLGSFRDVGLVAVHATAAPGAFGGRDVTIVVADFGRS